MARNADKSRLSYDVRVIAFDGKCLWSYDNYLARNVVIFGIGNTHHLILIIKNIGGRSTERISMITFVQQKQKLVLTLVNQRQNIV